MERTGEVTHIDGEWLTVTVCRPADCEKCNACRGNQKNATVQVRGQAKLGDLAVIEMPERKVMQASLTAYVLPLFFLLVGLFGGAAIGGQNADVFGAIGAVIGLGAAALCILLTEKKRRQNPDWHIQLKEIIPTRQE